MAEVVGIIATLFVLVSFLFKNLTVVRYVNILACIAFIVYGLMISAWSVWIGNAAIAVIHVVYLIKERRK